MKKKDNLKSEINVWYLVGLKTYNYNYNYNNFMNAEIDVMHLHFNFFIQWIVQKFHSWIALLVSSSSERKKIKQINLNFFLNFSFDGS